MENNNQPSIEDKFKEMDEIGHILERSGMYVGNIYPELKDYLLYKPSENKIVEIKNVPYNAGLVKLFDEVFTNSIDERRNKTKLFHIDEINVSVNTDGTFVISDNGGIPVVIHKEAKVYLPKMLFGRLRTSSNYTSDREGAGLNGIGSKLTNIFSKYFRVTTSDSKKSIDIQWSKNMRNIDFENVTDSKTHGSRFEFQLELERFEISALDLSTIRILQKRCIDGAAANPGLKINFESNVADGALNSSFKFDTFHDFVKIHIDTTKNELISQSSIDDITLVTNLGYDYGFVNGAVCSTGTHITKIEKQIISKVLDILKSKDIELITEKDIRNRFSLFCSVNVVNPNYDSQTKIKLTSKINTEKLQLNKNFLASLNDSQLVVDLVEYYNIKYLAEMKKNLRKLNSTIKNTKTKKLISCSSESDENELWLFEGTSAANGFQTYRNPVNMACYQLRGKVKNTLNLTKEQIVENQELREIIAALGLQFSDPKGNLKNCKFRKIIFATDMDTDGAHICGLLITFFAKNFPELFIDGRIYRAISPILIASKGDNEVFFYTQEEFEENRNSIKGWDLDYIKGLGSLQNHHYDTLINQQRLMKFTLKNKNYMDVIKLWFDKSTELRKEVLMTEQECIDED